MGRIERSFRFLGVLGEALPWAQGLFQLTHFVTAGCDARCGHCFYAVNRRRRELSIEEIRRVAGSIPRLRFLLISGGEPFLRNDLPAIIEAYFRATSFVNCSIPTNGLRTEAVLDAVRQICRISPDLSLSLSVSLDGFRELHDALRGVQGIFPRALATLAGAIRLKADFPNLHVGVVTTLMRENLAEIGRLIEFVRHEVGPDSHTLNAWRGSGPGMRPPGVTPSDYLALNRTLAALYAGAGRSLKRRMRDAANELRYEYIARVWREGGFIMPCRAGAREAVMGEEGDVFPCELMFNRGIGNVREWGYDLPGLMRGDAARQFIAWRRRERCVCTHECNTRTMLLLRPATLARILLRTARGKSACAGEGFC